jgi:phospholipid/cholesterol/gamma-HCH transport system permease protein
VKEADVRECFIKALAFGLLTISICSYQGFHAHRVRGSTGARAVSAATTKAVVLSCIAVLAADYVITSFLV